MCLTGWSIADGTPRVAPVQNPVASTWNKQQALRRPSSAKTFLGSGTSALQLVSAPFNPVPKPAKGSASHGDGRAPYNSFRTTIGCVVHSIATLSRQSTRAMES